MPPAAGFASGVRLSFSSLMTVVPHLRRYIRPPGTGSSPSHSKPKLITVEAKGCLLVGKWDSQIDRVFAYLHDFLLWRESARHERERMMDQQASIGLRQKQVFLQGLEAEPNPTFFRSAMKRGSERSRLNVRSTLSQVSH